jgi:hypothetical protein
MRAHTPCFSSAKVCAAGSQSGNSTRCTSLEVFRPARANHDLVVALVPLDDRAGTDAEPPAHFDRHGDLALRGDLGSGPPGVLQLGRIVHIGGRLESSARQRGVPVAEHVEFLDLH